MKWYRKPARIVVLLLIFFAVSLCSITAGSGCAPYDAAASSVGHAQEVSIPVTSGGMDEEIPATESSETTQQSAGAKKPAVSIDPVTTETAAAAAAAIKEMKSDAGKVLRVHFIDVGQADCEFVELPDGRTLLIDAGNEGDGPAVVQYIQNLGYSTIDYLICSHPHEDHIGGMAAVINNFVIGSIFMPKVSTTTQTFEDLLSTIQSKGYTITTAQAGVQVAPGISILSPAVNGNYGDELNDWSAVVSVCYGSSTFLFLGDAGTAPESTLSIDADVVKISHHGSRTAYSKSFFEEISPAIAVISVGKDNSYGLPDEEVLQGLTDVGAVIYRTDENSTIIAESDGIGVTIKAGGAVPAPENGTAAGTAPLAAASTEAASTEAASMTAASDADSVTVYKTDTGSKYHQADCSYLKDSKTPVSLADAKAEGLTPCSRCDPPE